MKSFTTASLLALIPMYLTADLSIEERLMPYHDYMETWTCYGWPWEGFQVKPLSRFYTFKKAFELIAENGKCVVELGTSRSFTHGGHPGCNLDDRIHWTPEQPENWDWGAGFFTRMAALCLSDRPIEIHTVDISWKHIERCKYMTYDLRDKIHYHISASQDFLAQCQFPVGIDLLYLDTGDMIDETAYLQLEEAKIIVTRDLIAKHGYILLDDVKNQHPKTYGDTSGLGKSKFSLPYFLDHGFEIVMDEYQVLLRKK